MPRTRSKKSAGANCRRLFPWAARVKNRRNVLRLLAGLVGLLVLPARVRARTLAAPAVRENLLRPPGAVLEHRYPGKCIRCGRCAEVCPYHCIQLLDIRHGLHAGTPVVAVETSPCYLCMKCVHICPTGALQPLEQQETRMGLAVIDRHQCVAWQPDSLLMCKTCYNVCPFRDTAIRMEEYRPHVDQRYCTGCGICTHACLVSRARGGKAINIIPAYASITLPEAAR